MSGVTLLTGQVLQFDANPFEAGLDAARHNAHGAVAIANGRSLGAGPVDPVRAAHPGADEVAYGDALILPGFVDAHAHYPQTASIASWGKRLIDWLNT